MCMQVFTEEVALPNDMAISQLIRRMENEVVD